MLLASRPSIQGCSSVCRSVGQWQRLARPISIAIPTTSSTDVTEKHRAPPVRRTVETTRSHSQANGRSVEGQRALELLKKGRLQAVSEVLAREGGEQLIVELARGVLASRKAKAANTNLLFQLLETLPNARDSNSLSFQRLVDLLTSEDRNSSEILDMVKRLGTLCASKGYEDFVASRISPIVSSKCTELEFAAWKRGVNEAFTTFNKIVVDTGRVFEDVGFEYEMKEPVERPLGILKLVEQTLPPLLPAPDGDLMFEVDTDEYVTLTEDVQDHHSSNTLEFLIINNDLEAASQLLQELQELHVDIPFSLTYAKAATLALQNFQEMDEVHQDVKMEQALVWFRLLPTTHMTLSWPEEMAHLQNLIDKCPLTHLSLVMRTALILAEKGHASRVTMTSVRTVFLYAPAKQAIAWLHQLEAANEAYWREAHPEMAEHRMRTVNSQGRGVAIRCLAQTQRFAEALSLFPDIARDKFYLSLAVHDFLIKGLSLSDDPGATRMAVEAQRLKDDVVAYKKVNTVPDIAKSSTPEPLTDDLIVALRILKRQTPVTPTHHPVTLFAFLESYLHSGHTRGVTSILNKSLQQNLMLASSLLTAEMLYYHRIQAPVRVIKTFVDHFYLVGVPIRRVLDVNRLETEYQREPSTSTSQSAQRFHQAPITSNTKLWPSPGHCSLVWYALAYMAETPLQVQGLYEKLQQMTKDGRDNDEELSKRGIQVLVAPRGTDLPINSWAFTPFIRRLSRSFGRYSGAQVITDMRELGLNPTIVHLTELAGMYARIGDKKAALKILAGLEKVEKQVQEGEDGDGSQPWSRHDAKLSGPDIFLYKSLIVGFVSSRLFAEADNVDRRMRKRFDIDGFEDPVFGEAYATLVDYRQRTKLESLAKEGQKRVAASEAEVVA